VDEIYSNLFPEPSARCGRAECRIPEKINIKTKNNAGLFDCVL
jgi:hypothetical protein